MLNRFKLLVATLAIVLSFAHPSIAGNGNNKGPAALQQPIDWQATWGGINFTGGQDEGLPSEQFQPKADIKRIVSDEGTQNVDLSSLKFYQIDLNNDGKADFIGDGKGYFPQYQKENAPVQVCNDTDGCFLSIYLSGEATNLITPLHNGQSCPATAAANTSCNPGCAATVEQCPALFRYNTKTVFDEQVLSWNFISASDFQAWSFGKSYQSYNNNPVLVTQRNNTNCYLDEMASNNNQCVKYYQFNADVDGGTFVDLYLFKQGTGNADFATSFSYKSAYNQDNNNGPAQNRSPDNADLRHARGMPMGSGFGHELKPGETLDIQFSNFTRTYEGNHPAEKGFAHYQISNYSDRSYFVPSNSDKEFCSFIDSHQCGVVVVPQAPTSPDAPQCPPEPPAPPQPPTPPAPHCPYVHPLECPHDQVAETTFGNDGCPLVQCHPVTPPPAPCPPPPEKVHFTTWCGDLTCPAVVKTPLTINATRQCQSSNGAYRSCEACMENAVLEDGSPDPSRSQGCSFAKTCEVNACLIAMVPAWPDANAPNVYAGTYTTLGECQSEVNTHPNQVMSSAVGSYPNNYWLLNNAWQNYAGGSRPLTGGSPYAQPLSADWCKVSFEYLCANGHLCVAGETQVALPDGSSKRIDEIKAGDMVLGFQKPKDALKPLKVTKLAVTPNEPLISINGELKLTPNHMVVTAKGYPVQAASLKVGDVLLRSDKTKVKIKTIAPAPSSGTVYNLEFETAGAGFVADGIRVIGYVK